MRKRQFIETIIFKVDPQLREKVVEISDREERSVAEVGRELLELGLQARAAAGVGVNV